MKSKKKVFDILTETMKMKNVKIIVLKDGIKKNLLILVKMFTLILRIKLMKLLSLMKNK